MKKETELWLGYADENFRSAEILLDSHLYNPTLQNVQQAIEKYLKALMIEFGLGLRRTHSISVLIADLEEGGLLIDTDEDDIYLIDSIYLASKYPLGSVLPDFDPDEAICRRCIEIASFIQKAVKAYLSYVVPV